MKITFDAAKYDRLAEAQRQRMDARQVLGERAREAVANVQVARGDLQQLRDWRGGLRDLEAEKRAEARVAAETIVLDRLKAEQQRLDAIVSEAGRLIEGCREFLQANGVRVAGGRLIPHGNLQGGRTDRAAQMADAMRFPGRP